MRIGLRAVQNRYARITDARWRDNKATQPTAQAPNVETFPGFIISGAHVSTDARPFEDGLNLPNTSTEIPKSLSTHVPSPP